MEWLQNQNVDFKGKLVEQRINRLAVTHSDDYKHYFTSSPCYKDLQNGPSRVKKLSRLFEEKSKTYSTRTNWWLEEKIKSTGESPSSPQSRGSLNRVKDHLSSSPAKPPMSKLDRIVNELLQKELTYIQALEKGIDFYVSVIKEGGEGVPHYLRNQTFKLFSNIEEICSLHKSSVYPRLLLCNGNACLIAQTISSFIQNDLFYCYMVYAINQRSADQWITHNYSFFEALRMSSDDLLGIHSFVIQPIQKLPRYKMLFDEMIKELSHNVPPNKETIAACCVAEKNVQRLLSRLNEALSINDIIETHEMKISDQMSILTSMQKDFGVDINEPMMLLVPKTSSNFPFRSPFNVYELGKFLKTVTLKVQECSTNRTFPCRVFLFEKCLLYAKIISDATLGYRNHFSFGSGSSFDTKDSQVSFRVCGATKKQDAIFSSDNIESIANIKTLINQFCDQRCYDSSFLGGQELNICEDTNITTDDEDDWIVAECDTEFVNLDQTLLVANSRFYIKSPEPESD